MTLELLLGIYLATVTKYLPRSSLMNDRLFVSSEFEKIKFVIVE